MKKDYTREELIAICEQCYVPSSKWGDRDSYIAQRNASNIHGLLLSGAYFELDIYSEDNIDINFHNISQEQNNNRYNGFEVDSLDSYLEENEDSEMFDSFDDSSFGYLPTQSRLDEHENGDWC